MNPATMVLIIDLLCLRQRLALMVPMISHRHLNRKKMITEGKHSGDRSSKPRKNKKESKEDGGGEMSLHTSRLTRMFQRMCNIFLLTVYVFVKK